MDRRDFLKGSSAAAIGLGSAAAAAKAADDARALAAPAIIPQRRTLRMASLWPDAVTGPGDHIRRFARRMEAASDGRWTIEIAKEPAVGANAFKAVMTGEADLYAGHEHAHRELHPAFSYFAGLPCGTGLNIDELDAWLVAAGGQDLWDELAGAFNMKSLVIGHSGPALGLRTLKLPAQDYFRGRRLAVMGLATDVLKAVDAIPAEYPAPTLAILIDNQSLDGVELIGQNNEMSPHHAPGLHLNKNMQTLPPINDTGYAISLGLRRSLWDGLANSERIMLAALAAEALAASRADALAHARSMAMMNGRSTATGSHTLPPHHENISSQLTRISTAIIADLAGYDDMARRIDTSYMAFKGVQRDLSAA